MKQKPFECGTIILAAGASSRMGQPKMLLRWGETTVLGYSIARWARLGAKQIAVVCDPKNIGIAQEIDRVGTIDRIFNDDPARGMFSSIVCAARWAHWNPILTHWAIALGDQPHLRQETLEQLISTARAEADSIVQPSFNGRARHPVILPREFFEMVRDARAETLKEFLQTNRTSIRLIEIPDAGLDLDLDYPEDYARAKRLYLRDDQRVG